MTMRVLLVVLCYSLSLTSSKTINFLTDFGAVPDDVSDEACEFNAKLLSQVLTENASGNILEIPENHVFHVRHGIHAKNIRHSILKLDGVLRFERLAKDTGHLNHNITACLLIEQSQNVTITSSGRGLIDGRGPHWWGIPLYGYVKNGEHRPRLLVFNETSDVLIENIILQDSPYHSLRLQNVQNVEVRDISIVARRTPADGHSWVDLTAFNTDGIDVSGDNVHVHDVDIWVQDDCIAVKDSEINGYRSTNMVFERINASGVGFTVGSIQGSTVQNITFRDSYLHRPLKSVYLKFAGQDKFWKSRNVSPEITDVRYVNITVEGPTQWPVWIGPAQQADNANPCHANPCSLCWPMNPKAKCKIVPKSHFGRLHLEDIQINNPKMSTGVILAGDDYKITDIYFHNVRVTKGDPVPMAKHNLHETFPGLLQPIHDPYVVETSLFADKVNEYRTIFGFAFSFEWDPIKIAQKSFTAIYKKLHPFRKPKWEKWNVYYKCTGVTNGTASGTTWPIPDCFQTSTNSELIHTGIRNRFRRPGLVIVIVGMLTALTICWRKRVLRIVPFQRTSSCRAALVAKPNSR